MSVTDSEAHSRLPETDSQRVSSSSCRCYPWCPCSEGDAPCEGASVTGDGGAAAAAANYHLIWHGPVEH